jgi:hypothetical protein
VTDVLENSSELAANPYCGGSTRSIAKASNTPPNSHTVWHAFIILYPALANAFVYRAAP